MSWPNVPLSAVSEHIRNGASIKQNKDSVGLPITRIETIADRTVNLDKCGYADLSQNEYPNYRLKQGDILISHINSENHLGKCAIFESDRIDIVHGMNLLCLRPNKKTNPKYLFHYLSSKDFLRKIPSITKKSVNQASFTVTAFKNLEIPLPPLEEQKRIAAILDKADAIRRKRQQAIQLADDFLRSVFLDMFGDPVANPKGWPVKKLKDITSKIGSGSTPRGGSKVYQEQGVSLVRSLNIHDNEFRHKDLVFINNELAENLKNVELEKNDILLNITGASVCRCTIVPENVLPGRVNQHVCIIRANNHIEPGYLMHLLISPPYKHLLLKIAGVGATREALTKTQIENLEITIPPANEQQRFLKLIEPVKNIKGKSNLFDNETLLDSLSQKAFRGEL